MEERFLEWLKTKKPEMPRVSARRSTSVWHQDEELERFRRIDVERAVLEERLSRLERQLEERIRCHHGGTGDSEIVDGPQRRGRSPMTAQWEQRDTVPRGNSYIAIWRK